MMRSAEDATSVELRRLELLLMDPVVRKDRNQIAALLDEDFVEFGASGRVWTRQSILDLLLAESYTAPEMRDFACRALAPDIVLVTYLAVRGGEPGERVASLRSSIWIKESGAWKMRFHQGTRANQ